MSVIYLEILIIVILVIINGALAMSEIAIISARKTRLRKRAESGHQGARAALELADAPNRFLSTVQIGITLIGILAGAFGGATLAEQLAVWLNRIPLLAPYGEVLSVVLVVFGITYLSLIIGELVPKRLAMNNAERIAALVARPMRMLAKFTYPAVQFLSISTETVLKLLGAKPSAEPPITEEEIHMMIDQGTQAGVFEPAERQLVASVFRLADLNIHQLMTPRPNIIALNIDAPPADNWARMAASGHSFFPVYRGNLDNLLGIVSVKELWDRAVAGQPTDLKATIMKPLLVPETISPLMLLEAFKRSGQHIALVVDEHGGIEGLVTIIDVLEAIVGDIPVHNEPDRPQALQREDGSWLLDGLLPIMDVKEILQVERFPDEEEHHFQTLAGFVTSFLGVIPKAGDYFQWQGRRFEVIDMDGNRVDKVLVMPLLLRPSQSPHPRDNDHAA